MRSANPAAHNRMSARGLRSAGHRFCRFDAKWRAGIRFVSRMVLRCTASIAPSCAKGLTPWRVTRIPALSLQSGRRPHRQTETVLSTPPFMLGPRLQCGWAGSATPGSPPGSSPPIDRHGSLGTRRAPPCAQRGAQGRREAPSF